MSLLSMPPTHHFSLPSIHSVHSGLRTPPHDAPPSASLPPAPAAAASAAAFHPRLPSVKSLLCDEPEPLPQRQLSPPLERFKEKPMMMPMTPASTPPLYEQSYPSVPAVAPHPASCHLPPAAAMPPAQPQQYHHLHMLPPLPHYSHHPAPPSYYPQYPVPQAQPQPPKPKRRRATSYQVARLNEVFEQTFFPSSEQRLDLAKELNMTPRVVQIWFQNKRQGWKSEHKRPVPRN